MTKANYMALDDFQSLWTNKCKPWIQSNHEYKDVYIGAAAASSTVIDDDYYRESVTKDRPIAISNASGYIWIILPSTYSPVAMMSGMEIPMTQDGTTTIEEETYKIWKSANTYSGTFNIYLL